MKFPIKERFLQTKYVNLWTKTTKILRGAKIFDILYEAIKMGQHWIKSILENNALNILKRYTSVSYHFLIGCSLKKDILIW